MCKKKAYTVYIFYSFQTEWKNFRNCCYWRVFREEERIHIRVLKRMLSGSHLYLVRQKREGGDVCKTFALWTLKICPLTKVEVFTLLGEWIIMLHLVALKISWPVVFHSFYLMNVHSKYLLNNHCQPLFWLLISLSLYSW